MSRGAMERMVGDVTSGAPPDTGPESLQPETASNTPSAKIERAFKRASEGTGCEKDNTSDVGLGRVEDLANFIARAPVVESKLRVRL